MWGVDRGRLAKGGHRPGIGETSPIDRRWAPGAESARSQAWGYETPVGPMMHPPLQSDLGQKNTPQEHETLRRPKQTEHPRVPSPGYTGASNKREEHKGTLPEPHSILYLGPT
eukprot:6933160-Pyramimonas_sp.AAC.1